MKIFILISGLIFSASYCWPPPEPLAPVLPIIVKDETLLLVAKLNKLAAEQSSYSFNGGRLGDNLVTYLPMHYEPRKPNTPISDDGEILWPTTEMWEEIERRRQEEEDWANSHNISIFTETRPWKKN